MDFLYYYVIFDEKNTGIYTCSPGKKPEKSNQYQLIQVLYNMSVVQIDDPLNPHNNVGKSSFNFH